MLAYELYRFFYEAFRDLLQGCTKSWQKMGKGVLSLQACYFC
jgi:hypothetical protein